MNERVARAFYSWISEQFPKETARKLVGILEECPQSFAGLRNSIRSLKAVKSPDGLPLSHIKEGLDGLFRLVTRDLTPHEIALVRAIYPEARFVRTRLEMSDGMISTLLFLAKSSNRDIKERAFMVLAGGLWNPCGKVEAGELFPGLSIPFYGVVLLEMLLRSFGDEIRPAIVAWVDSMPEDGVALRALLAERGGDWVKDTLAHESLDYWEIEKLVTDPDVPRAVIFAVLLRYKKRGDRFNMPEMDRMLRLMGSGQIELGLEDHERKAFSARLDRMRKKRRCAR